MPVLDWLTQLRRTNWKAFAKCVAALERLTIFGHELRRPLADFLCDGIYEPRVRQGTVNYRILYFFHERNVAVVSHGITKEDSVPKEQIALALRRKRDFLASPGAHSFEKELPDA